MNEIKDTLTESDSLNFQWAGESGKTKTTYMKNATNTTKAQRQAYIDWVIANKIILVNNDSEIATSCTSAWRYMTQKIIYEL